MAWDREPDMLQALFRLAPFGDRFRMIRAKSVDAVRFATGYVPKGLLDFVYIDACHTYEAVVADIAAWVPVIRPGGVLAGHDYDEEHAPVMRAVNEFAERKQWPLFKTHLHAETPSWYFFVI